MADRSRTLLTIIVEDSIEHLLIDDLGRVGATGFTVWPAWGSGTHGYRRGDWSQNRNRCLQVLCDEATLRRIEHEVLPRYRADYALVAFHTPVELLTGD